MNPVPGGDDYAQPLNSAVTAGPTTKDKEPTVEKDENTMSVHEERRRVAENSLRFQQSTAPPTERRGSIQCPSKDGTVENRTFMSAPPRCLPSFRVRQCIPAMSINNTTYPDGRKTSTLRISRKISRS
jgi:hypothetical protein